MTTNINGIEEVLRQALESIEKAKKYDEFLDAMDATEDEIVTEFGDLNSFIDILCQGRECRDIIGIFNNDDIALVRDKLNTMDYAFEKLGITCKDDIDRIKAKLDRLGWFDHDFDFVGAYETQSARVQELLDNVDCEDLDEIETKFSLMDKVLEFIDEYGNDFDELTEKLNEYDDLVSIKEKVADFVNEMYYEV